jgi:hypothetical protein
MTHFAREPLISLGMPVDPRQQFGCALRAFLLDYGGITGNLSPTMKSISELLHDISKTKEALRKAQEAYDASRKALAESPQLAEVGLQVIPAKTGKKRFISEATRQKMSAAQKARRKEAASL